MVVVQTLEFAMTSTTFCRTLEFGVTVC